MFPTNKIIPNFSIADAFYLIASYVSTPGKVKAGVWSQRPLVKSVCRKGSRGKWVG
jgi:hypothetical protein